MLPPIPVLIGATAGQPLDRGVSKDMSKHSIAHEVRYSRSSEFLIRELRESQPYLADEGWHQVANLMLAAADEIEQLQARIGKLEGPNPRARTS
jgi:hypothetical protein